MRYAILSDIHANVDSLQQALSKTGADDVIVSLGDVVGYGPNPNEVVRLLRDRARHAVLGNHDLAALENFGVEHFNEAARAAILWTQGVLDEASRGWLNLLPYELRFPDFLLVHGAPVKYFEYILDKEEAAAAFDRTDAPLIFVGHTHIAQYWVRDGSRAIGHKHMQHGGSLELEDGKRYIVDVGSVGQPRDLNPLASFAFYDPSVKRVEWLRYEYPIEEVQRKMRAARLPRYLVDRLSRGR
ncbi:MAG: metallophosphoesterase family protein [Candidatus Eremiobacteraeota bacterium]|nr:metallophosphoesterase family protein [Candidatus Eremiobacteraeota bacterium]MBV9698987.1 metallophosphoesterase family protein [Candidatus Eremiobacteraeota bacterium]